MEIPFVYTLTRRQGAPVVRNLTAESEASAEEYVRGWVRAQGGTAWLYRIRNDGRLVPVSTISVGEIIHRFPSAVDDRGGIVLVMGIFRDQTERVAAFKAACAECKAEADEGKRSSDELGEGEGDCTECELPACGFHGRAYPTAGWQHESCHEAMDFTRADDGRY